MKPAERHVTIVHDLRGTAERGQLTADSIDDLRRDFADEGRVGDPVAKFKAAANAYLDAVDRVVPILETELEQVKEHRAAVAMMLAHPPIPGAPHDNVSVFGKPGRSAPGVGDG